MKRATLSSSRVFLPFGLCMYLVGFCGCSIIGIREGLGQAGRCKWCGPRRGGSDHTCAQLVDMGLTLVAAPVAGVRDGAETMGRVVGSKQQ